MKKHEIILVVCVIILLVVNLYFIISYDNVYVDDSGTITDKWIITTISEWGSEKAYIFEIDKEYYIRTDIFDYYNYNITDFYEFYGEMKNPMGD